MAISEDNQRYLQELVNRNILTIGDLNNVPPTISDMPSILAEVGRAIDKPAYLAYALQQEPVYLRIPEMRMDESFLDSLPMDALYELTESLIVPLCKIADTIWLGVGRPAPCDLGRIQEILHTKNIGWNILLPEEFIAIFRQLEQKKGKLCQ